MNNPNTEFWAELAESNYGPEGPPQQCSRCASLAECFPVSLLADGEGNVLDPCILCQTCRGLMYRDRDKFWAEGWDNHLWVRRKDE